MLFNFVVYGAFYVTGEVMWDRTSHISMFFAGGIIGLLGEWYLTFGLCYPLYALLIGLTILTIEYAFGKIFNKDYTIWDYRNKAYNFQGQICLSFGIMWTVIIPPIIIYISNILCTVRSIT